MDAVQYSAAPSYSLLAGPSRPCHADALLVLLGHGHDDDDQDDDDERGEERDHLPVAAAHHALGGPCALLEGLGAVRQHGGLLVDVLHTRIICVETHSTTCENC